MKKNLGLIIFLLFLLGLILFTYGDYGIGWDEIYYIMSGSHYWSKILGFLQIPVNIPFNTEEPTLRYILAQGVIWDILVMMPAVIFNNFTPEMFHLVKALMVLPTFLFVGLIMKTYCESRREQACLFPTNMLVLVPMVLLFLFPRFWGDMFINAADIPRALLLAMSIYLFLRYLQGDQKVLQQVLLGLSLGFLINQRAAFWYVLIVDLIILYVAHRQNKREKLLIFMKKCGVMVLITVIVLHLINPYLWQHPLIGIFEIVNYNRQFPFAGNVLFEGNVSPVQDLPWYYLPKMMLITIPVLTLALFVIGQIRLISLIWQKKEKYINKLTYIYLLAVFYIPLFLIFLLRPPTYDGWRQVLFLTVPIVIIAALGFDFLLGNGSAFTKVSAHRRGRCLRGIVITIIIVINIILTVKQMIRLHPYQYVYFNSLVGGLKGAFRQYETDYWGLGFKEGTLWFNDHINNPQKNYKIYLAEPLPLAAYYFRPNMQAVTDINRADYIFAFTRSNVDLFLRGKTVHTVERDGIPLIFIKEL